MNRRVLLRGLGGAAVAAPFLGSLGGRRARAAGVTPPKRLIVMFTHYGCVTTRFFPASAHGPLAAADLEPTTLAPLARFADKLLLPRGIRTMNEWTADLARGQGNDPHGQVVASYFTCHPVTPNSDDPFGSPTSPLFEQEPTGPSLDHVIAQQLGPTGAPLLVRVGNGHDTAQSAISYSAPGTPFPGVSVTQAFSLLTGLYPELSPLSPDSYRAARGASVLDLVSDDLAALERSDMSQSDRLKLEAWKELLHQTGVVMSAQCTPALASTLGLTEANFSALSSAGRDALVDPITDALDGADLCSNLAVLAAACQANPVIVLKYPATYVFHALGLTVESHGLSHRIGNASMQGPCLEGCVDMLLKIDGYYAKKFAHLVGQLDAFSEGEGTLLDHSAAIWFQEMSDGAAHNLNNLPIVQAGSLGGYFRTGQSINVADGASDLTRGNSEAFCAAGDTDSILLTDQTTGTDPALASAPINKYYCGLMNALGVKAGADGFPLAGGQAEVTHFGLYDKTEDFVGGGVNPPAIHDPGEFTALKANG